MKSDELENYRKALLIQKRQYDLADKKYLDELKALLSPSQIEKIFVEKQDDLLHYTSGIILPDILIEIIKYIMESNKDQFNENIILNAEMLNKIPFFVIDLETEVCEMIPIEDVVSFLDKCLKDIYKQLNELRQQRYDLNEKIYHSSNFINFIFRRNEKAEVLTAQYNYLSKFDSALRECKILFSDRNYNGIIKTAKEEFESVFGIRFNITTHKFDINGEV